MKPSNIEIYFSGLISKMILRNPIVATIVLNIGVILRDYKKKIDNTLNTDI